MTLGTAVVDGPYERSVTHAPPADAVEPAGRWEVKADTVVFTLRVGSAAPRASSSPRGHPPVSW